MKLEKVIVQPILTEKATQSASQKVYTFEVDKKANKNQVKEVLQTIYGVKISGVRMITRKGKAKRVGKKMATKNRPNRKIAIVQVTEGTINVFPQV